MRASALSTGAIKIKETWEHDSVNRLIAVLKLKRFNASSQLAIMTSYLALMIGAIIAVLTGKQNGATKLIATQKKTMTKNSVILIKKL